MNKILLKLAGLLFIFSIIDIFIILYYALSCSQTHSPWYYCDAFAFGIIFYVLGIPALILFGLSIITLVFSKWYKKGLSYFVKWIIIIFGTIIFVASLLLHNRFIYSIF